MKEPGLKLKSLKAYRLGYMLGICALQPSKKLKGANPSKQDFSMMALACVSQDTGRPCDWASPKVHCKASRRTHFKDRQPFGGAAGQAAFLTGAELGPHPHLLRIGGQLSQSCAAQQGELPLGAAMFQEAKTSLEGIAFHCTSSAG